MEKLFCTELLLGKSKIEKLKKSFVVIVGLGAVGSYAAEALARAGVGKFRLVDFDKIKVSNFNRHLLALNSTLGELKVRAVQARIHDIRSSCKVEIREQFAAEETMDSILEGDPDLVIDAIDSLNPKAQVLTACYEQRVPLISSMGAAVRTDFFSIKAGDLFKTSGCPLARELRARLRKKNIRKGIFCIYSDQISDKIGYRPPPLINEEEDYPRGRKRNKLGSLPTITGAFGLAVAHFGIQYLTGDFKLPRT